MKPGGYLLVTTFNGGDIIKQIQSRYVFGAILIIAGILLTLNNLDVEVFRFAWPGLIIIVGLYLIYRDARTKSGADSGYSQFRIFGDTRHTDFSGKVDGTDISHFIGDTHLNLAGADLAEGINRINISTFIGDTEILVPEKMAVKVHCSSAISDLYLFDQKRSGIFVSTSEKTAGYDTAIKKLSINCSSLIGDIKIRQMTEVTVD